MTRQFADLVFPVQTRRLTLRRLDRGDAADVFEYRSHPDVSQWLSSYPSDFDEFERSFG